MQRRERQCQNCIYDGALIDLYPAREGDGAYETEKEEVEEGDMVD